MRPDYAYIINDVLQNGSSLDSRIGETKEVLGFQVNYPVGELVKRPRMSRLLGWVEILQSIGGYYDLNQIIAAAPKADATIFSIEAAYGPRLKEQLSKIVKQLGLNPESRRALLHIGDREDGYEVVKPCTSLMQALIREGRLDLHIYLRSWDLISGFVYDTMVFSAVALALAHCLFLKPGRIIATAGSAHIYGRDTTTQKIVAQAYYGRFFKLDEDLPTDMRDLQDWARETAGQFPWPKREAGHVPPGIHVYKRSAE